MVIKFSGKKISGQNILGWVKKKSLKKLVENIFVKKKFGQKGFGGRFIFESKTKIWITNFFDKKFVCLNRNMDKLNFVKQFF